MEHNLQLTYTIFIFSVVVMVMDTENKFARAVAHLYKGQTFGVDILSVIKINPFELNGISQ